MSDEVTAPVPPGDREALAALRDDDNRTWIGDPIPPRTPDEAALDDVISRALRMDSETVEHVTDAILARWRLVPVESARHAKIAGTDHPDEDIDDPPWAD